MVRRLNGPELDVLQYYDLRLELCQKYSDYICIEIARVIDTSAVGTSVYDECYFVRIERQILIVPSISDHFRKE